MREIVLKEIQLPEDLEYLYKAMTDKENWLYSSALHFNTKEDFSNWLISKLQGEFHDFYMIKSKCDGKTIGYVHNFDFSLINRNCKIMVYVSEEYRMTGIGIYAPMLFFKKLFKTYPLIKIYFTIVSANNASRKPCRNAGLEYEGSMKKFRCHNGIFYDMEVYSMNREKFKELKERLKI